MMRAKKIRKKPVPKEKIGPGPEQEILRLLGSRERFHKIEWIVRELARKGIKVDPAFIKRVNIKQMPILVKGRKLLVMHHCRQQGMAEEKIMERTNTTKGCDFGSLTSLYNGVLKEAESTGKTFEELVMRQFGKNSLEPKKTGVKEGIPSTRKKTEALIAQKIAEFERTNPLSPKRGELLDDLQELRVYLKRMKT